MLRDDYRKLSQRVFNATESDHKIVPVSLLGEKPISFLCYFHVFSDFTTYAERCAVLIALEYYSSVLNSLLKRADNTADGSHARHRRTTTD